MNNKTQVETAGDARPREEMVLLGFLRGFLIWFVVYMVLQGQDGFFAVTADRVQSRKFRIDARKVASTNTIRISGGDSECNFDYRAYRTISFDGVASGVNKNSQVQAHLGQGLGDFKGFRYDWRVGISFANAGCLKPYRCCASLPSWRTPGRPPTIAG